MGIQMHADIKNYQRVRERLRQIKPGEQITVKILRGGRVVKLSTTMPK